MRNPAKTDVETCLARAYLHGSDVDIIHEKMRTGEIRDNYADISKAKKILGYVPKISLGHGLRSLVEDD